jgi:transcriptional regulator GlxA family with amidase domain
MSMGQTGQSADLATRRRVSANIGRRLSRPKDIDPKISVITRHVGFFIYPHFNLIDLSGPIEAFTLATDMAPGSYRLTVMSLEGGEIESSSRVKVMSQVAVPKGIDTFVIVGDSGMSERKISTETIDFIRAAATGARRTASVCMGAFLLAASGLLDGRLATTHWRFAAKLQATYPNVRVDSDRIFINERGVWTSAGMTAGIDMTLALIKEDLGRDISRAVARMLVVYYRRPGGQHQYSSLLELEPNSDRIKRVLNFAREHLSDPLSVERLAEVAHLSPRQFGRAFVTATGIPPAKAIERLRVESARCRWRIARITLKSSRDGLALATPSGCV